MTPHSLPPQPRIKRKKNFIATLRRLMKRANKRFLYMLGLWKDWCFFVGKKTHSFIREYTTSGSKYFSSLFYSKKRKGSHLSLTRNLGTIFFFVFFSVLITQPHLFEVDVKSSSPTSSMVYAKMGEENSGGQNGDLQFELFMPGGDDGDRVVYTIKSGDSLSSIAQTFGTTVGQLLSTNSLEDQNNLRPGTKIEITYIEDQMIYEMDKEMTVKDFASEYALSEEDIMTLNYYENSETIISAGEQVFLDVSRKVAENKGLVNKVSYVRPEGLIEDLPEDYLQKTGTNIVATGTGTIFTGSVQNGSGQLLALIEGEQLEVLGDLLDREDNKDVDSSGQKKLTVGQIKEKIKQNNGIDTFDQVVISAEQTTDALTNIPEPLEEPSLIPEEENGGGTQPQPQPQPVENDSKQNQQLDLPPSQQVQPELDTSPTQLGEERIAVAVAEQAEENPQPQQEEKKPEPLQCSTGKCVHKGKCWALPENAYCVPEDQQNAWACNEGFIDTGSSCMDKATYDAEKAKRRGIKPTKHGRVAQWYFNPGNEGYYNGWAGGHCTQFAGRYRWKHYGIMTNWRGNAKYRWANASAAGWQVGKTPEVGAIIVTDNRTGRWSAYGHVGVVVQIDWESNSVLVESMNIIGRYMVSQDRVSMYDSGMVGYVYPRKR